MIWCVEDDDSIRDIERYALENSGFETRGFQDGKAFWEALSHEQPQLVILDVMLPGMNGIDILMQMKSSAKFRQVPVILATAKGQEYDRIKGLDLGADDYIVKPFSVMEMVSRVKAVLRRTEHSQPSKLLRFKDLILNINERTTTLNNAKISLTYKEFELLLLFLSHPGMVYTREQLFSSVWKSDYLGDSRTLDSHIRTLRHKIEPYGKMIETVRNVGYKWEAGHD